MPDPHPPIISCFAHERGDARVMKRIAALQAQGWKLRGYIFHRIRDRVDVPPFWENVELGITENRRYLKRIFVFLRSLWILRQHRKQLAETQAYYVVNTDNAVLALTARWMSGRSGKNAPPLILELADVQPAMLGQGLKGKLMRAAERQVLRRTALLVTTSPAFVREYFTPVQQFPGPVFLLENRVYPSIGITMPEDAAGTPLPAPVHGGRPWVVGLFGAFRCRRSIELMRALAQRFPGTIHFYLRGYPSGVDAAGIAALLPGLPNLEWSGAYHYPDDLPDLYRRIDLNWTFDFADTGTNSAWLLPNRIYEGGLFACPSLADATTETGRWVAAHATGWTLAEPLEESLAAFFQSLTEADWREKQAACAALPRHLTCGEQDYAALSDAIRQLAARQRLPEPFAAPSGRGPRVSGESGGEGT